MPQVFDGGLALFAGLNAVPKHASLSEYSCRVDPRCLPGLLRDFALAARRAGLPRGGSLDLDFQTVPYHGDDAFAEKHSVSKRSRNDEILRYAEDWKRRTGSWPSELVFDSKLTTYANLARLQKRGIRFLTLRRRGTTILADLEAEPASGWNRLKLTNVERRYKNPMALESTITLKHYERPTLLITNQMEAKAAALVDRYARRMLIENAIAQAIDLFHMDALSAAVP